jgi:hypothetical protein
MKPTMTRRSALLSGAGVAALTAVAAAGLPLPAGAQPPITATPITADQFLALSSRLTGAAVADLDRTMAATLRDGFIAAGRGGALAELAARPEAGTGPLADDLVAAWYSGLYTQADGSQAIAGYTGALLWTALDFTKPPGFCGGETGYWADPPQT